ncbi:class I adenylate-forming enzyme family protein [Mycolicibacterium sp. XJ1819]
MPEAPPRTSTWSQRVYWFAEQERPAIVTPTKAISGPNLLERVGGAATVLSGIGVPAGTPIVGLIDDLETSIALVLAGSALERPYAPLGTRLTAAELAAVVARLGTPVIITTPRCRAQAADIADRVRVEIVEISSLPAASPPAPAADPGAVAAILHTSGTTGAPKAIAYTEARLTARLNTWNGIVPLGPRDVYLSCASFHHVAGLGAATMALGSGAAASQLERFDPQSWHAFRTCGVTHATVVPAMLDSLLKHGVLADMPSLRYLIYGASPIDSGLLKSAMAALPDTRFVQIYGQTEGTPITIMTPDDHLSAVADRPELGRSCGRAAPGVELQIAAPDDHGVGEVLARGDHLSVDGDGWLHTGDVGRLTDDGYLHLSGRLGDTIIRGGENVRPLEVEAVLRMDPDVADVAVVGLPDPAMGQRIAALVVPASTSMPDWSRVRRAARSQLAGFKLPEVWLTVDRLPRNANGKILRREVVAVCLKESARQPSP